MADEIFQRWPRKSVLMGTGSDWETMRKSSAGRGGAIKRVPPRYIINSNPTTFPKNLLESKKLGQQWLQKVTKESSEVLTWLVTDDAGEHPSNLSNSTRDVMKN